jgi:hypothetical protein
VRAWTGRDRGRRERKRGIEQYLPGGGDVGRIWTWERVDVLIGTGLDFVSCSDLGGFRLVDLSRGVGWVGLRRCLQRRSLVRRFGTGRVVWRAAVLVLADPVLWSVEHGSIVVERGPGQFRGVR